MFTIREVMAIQVLRFRPSFIATYYTFHYSEILKCAIMPSQPLVSQFNNVDYKVPTRFVQVGMILSRRQRIHVTMSDWGIHCGVERLEPQLPYTARWLC